MTERLQGITGFLNVHNQGELLAVYRPIDSSRSYLPGFYHSGLHGGSFFSLFLLFFGGLFSGQTNEGESQNCVCSLG